MSLGKMNCNCLKLLLPEAGLEPAQCQAPPDFESHDIGFDGVVWSLGKHDIA